MRSALGSIILGIAVLTATASQAATEEEIDRLFRVTGLPDLLLVMRDEGLVEAGEIAEGLFPGRSVSGWKRTAEAIYEPEMMRTRFRDAFGAALADAEVGEVIAFFESDLGRGIVEREIEARRAFSDEAIETAAEEAFEKMAAEGRPRTAQIAAFIEANDLLERNVMGAMNSSYNFYRGLADGGGFEMTEREIIADVWSQEPEIREDTEDWLEAYFSLAYSDLSDEEFDRYLALSETDAGQALNAALFIAFDALFDEVSYALGLAASRSVGGEDI